MRAAPAVAVRTSGAGPWRWAQCLLHAWAAAGLAGWCALWLGLPGAAAASIGLVAALASALIAWLLTRAAPRRLAWDGAAWSLGDAGPAVAPGRVTVMLDLGSWMLLRFATLADGAPARSRRSWLAVSRGSADGAWHGLRAAVSAAPAEGAAAPLRRQPAGE